MAAWRWWCVVVLAALCHAVIPEGETAGGVAGVVEVPRATCPSGCTCTMPGYVVCRAAPGDIAPPTPPRDTHTLLLEGYSASPAPFLARLPALTHLGMTGGRLERLDQLPPLPQLEVLEVTFAGLLDLASAHLPRITPALRRLDVSHNRLTSLNASDVSGLAHLETLSVQSNPLHQVSRDALEGLTNLKYLDLSGTQVAIMHHQWAVDAPALTHLNVSRARLKEVPRLAHAALHTLDVAHNFLTFLPEGFLAHLPRLHVLHLAHNTLAHIRLASLSGAPLLHKLDLSYNHLVNIDEFVFSELGRLHHLDLASNAHLMRVEHGAFTGLHELRSLSLRNTSALREVEEVAFAGLPVLQLLDLTNSGLTVLPRSISLLANTTAVLLQDTRLRCDCHHTWLPHLLAHTNISRWSGVDPISCTDGHMRSPSHLGVHLSELECRAPQVLQESGLWVRARGGESAVLQCNVTGHPTPRILWATSTQHVFRHNSSTSEGEWVSHQLASIEAAAATWDPVVEVLDSGQLLIKDVTRVAMGRYKCFAYNSVGNASAVTFLGLHDTPLRNLYIESLLFGFACAALFLLITLTVQFVNFLMDRMGWSCCWSCCCCKDRLSPKARQIRKLLESVESYKSNQLERLRENYNAQVASIKDSCYLQMERIRESYGGQTKHLKDLRDYSTQGLTTVKEQYTEQLNNIRDYSVLQMNKVRENYVFQRHRIRKFSAHQLLKLRETYKYQQKTLNKILENLPDLYLQNCRTGSCQRTDSILFDDALHGIDAYYKVDFFDTQSHGSDYFTPSSTLTRSFKSSKDKTRHSRNSSSTSFDYVEAQPWMKRDSLSVGGTSPVHAPSQGRTHNRSFSVATPTSYIPEVVRTHKRSLSATHPYQRVPPVPEARGVPARITLCEEASDYTLATPPTSPRSVPATPCASVRTPTTIVEESLPGVHVQASPYTKTDSTSTPADVNNASVSAIESNGHAEDPNSVSILCDPESPLTEEDELLTAGTDLESNASTSFETAL